MTLYAATSNPGKLREFTQTAAAQGIAVLALPGLGQMPEPVEDADSFLGNAELKARTYSLTLPAELVFADDSGIEVRALHGAPGIYSARYWSARYWSQDMPMDAPPDASTPDARNNAKLLSRMRDEADRAARYVCALAVARDGEVQLRAEGVCEGELLSAARGAGGFGYDPLFLLPSLGRTMAELEPEEKWQISHRGHAFRSLLAQIQEAGLSRDRTAAR
jgi:XTP/dITP diphosphohydrolase